MDSKTQWRQTILAQRRQLSPAFVQEASKKAQSHFLSLEEFNLAEKIGFYASFHNEIETASLFAKAHALRKEVFYPAVNPQDKTVRFYRVRNQSELQPGFAGILEPAKRNHPLGDLNYLNLILVPGVAFDKKGDRIGFGHGYYDRLLEGFHGKRVALAYEFQMCDSLPSQPRDQRVDIVVTEERILRIV